MHRPNNTIYIENEDILESLNESQTFDATASAAMAPQDAEPKSQSEAKDRSRAAVDGSTVLVGDTGTTALPGST